jgi:hypothetical protein
VLKVITLKIEESVEVEWKGRAKLIGLTLSAWIRKKCEAPDLVPLMLPGGPTPKEMMDALAINDSNKQYYHTASSNRHTCLCQSCVNYRTLNDVPFGGFK